MIGRCEIILAVRKVAEDSDKTPTIREFLNAQHKVKQSDIYENFDSWNTLLEEMGLPLNHRSNPNTSREGLIAQVKELAERLGRTPTVDEFDDDPDLPSSGTVLNRFGTWNKFLKAAGVGVVHSTTVGTTDELLIAQVKMLAAELGRAPRSKEFDSDPRVVSCTLIKKRFGSWVKFLETAGLEVSCRKEVGNYDVSDEVLISQLKTMAGELGKTPTFTEFKNSKETAGATTVTERFGSWNNFLKAAELEPNVKLRVGISKEELVEQLKELSRELGRVPKYEDFGNSKKTAGVSTAVRRFGSWNNFLQAAELL